MTAGRSTRAVVIGAASRELRRRLGPTAWIVLEEMLVGSVETAGECTAGVSIRGLALSLGIAKDTPARAIRRLRNVELLSASQPELVAACSKPAAT